MITLPRRHFLRLGLGAGCAAAGATFAARRSEAALQEFRRTDRALGTTIELRVLHADEMSAEIAIDAALAAVDRVESLMSLYRPHSQLCELNRTGRVEDPDPWFLDVLRAAVEVSSASRGAFDVTVQPLWNCWTNATRAGRLPTEAELAAARGVVDWRAVAVSPDEVAFRRPGMQMTLNGIAQGFAADRAADALRRFGVEHALIDTGEIRPLGKNRASSWSVGVQHPREADAYSAVARLNGRALSTSGDYSTTFTADRRHHHIVDPHIGYSPGELASATVVAPTACEADALSTAVLVLGAESGLRLVADRPDVDALFVYKDGRTVSTAGFPEEVTT